MAGQRWTQEKVWDIPTLADAFAYKSGLDAPEDWLPETWEKRGFLRYWGDAAVNDQSMTILRREENGDVEYVILCAFLRRPLHITAKAPSWGSF